MIADEMISNWREYVELGEFLRYTWSPRKSFSEGHWKKWQGWPLDRQVIALRNGARVGRIDEAMDGGLVVEAWRN
jgi:hypothetical protein